MAGESYAGVYVPYMAWRIDQQNKQAEQDDFKFNLKGFIVGNPVTDWQYDGDSSYLSGGHYRGLVGNELNNNIT